MSEAQEQSSGYTLDYKMEGVDRRAILTIVANMRELLQVLLDLVDAMPGTELACSSFDYTLKVMRGLIEKLIVISWLHDLETSPALPQLSIQTLPVNAPMNSTVKITCCHHSIIVDCPQNYTSTVEGILSNHSLQRQANLRHHDLTQEQFEAGLGITEAFAIQLNLHTERRDDDPPMCAA